MGSRYLIIQLPNSFKIFLQIHTLYKGNKKTISNLLWNLGAWTIRKDCNIDNLCSEFCEEQTPRTHTPRTGENNPDISASLHTS
jgi:hypothetical protein